MAGKDSMTTQEEVRRKLTALGRDPNTIDSRTMRQLVCLEEVVRDEEANVRVAKATVRGRGFALNAMSEASGISRATFYNKPLLAEYVKLSKDEIVGDPDAVASKAELDEAKKKISQMMERDGDLVLALAENERLEKRVDALRSALEDKGTNFEGISSANIIRLDSKAGKKEEE